MRKTVIKKNRVWTVAILILSVLLIGYKVKKQRDVNERLVFEKKGAIELKNHYKNINKIKTISYNELAEGTKKIYFDVVLTSGKTVEGNVITIRDSGFCSRTGLVGGKTEESIKVIYTNRKEEIIK